MAQVRLTQKQRREAAEKRRKRSVELADAIERRCNEQDIPVRVLKAPVGPMVEVELPTGRGRRKIFAGGTERLERLLETPFESYVILSELLAICSYQDGLVEGLVESAGNRPVRQILHRRLEDEEGVVPSPLLHLKDGNVSISLGSPSKDMQALLVRRMGAEVPLALRIEGIEIDRHDLAKEMLERIANSLFLEMDSAFGIPLILSRVRRFPLDSRPRQKGADRITFPVSEYDPQAMALYWYGRGASGMPLLRFLAFYQVLEFYFPIYADREVRQRVKSVVKDPLFKPHDEAYISQIMNALTALGRRGFADEKSQLKAAVRGSTAPEAIRDFLQSTDARSTFFSDRKNKNSPSTVALRAEMSDDDLLNSAAERIYEIRCRIVHSKDSDSGRRQLLPFSPEADRMEQDIALMESIARGALVASSQQLSI